MRVPSPRRPSGGIDGEIGRARESYGRIFFGDCGGKWWATRPLPPAKASGFARVTKLCLGCNRGRSGLALCSPRPRRRVERQPGPKARGSSTVAVERVS